LSLPGPTTPFPPPARFYRLAWGFYLALAVAGVLWIGVENGRVPLGLFLDARADLRAWPADLAIGAAAGLLLVGLWRLGRRAFATARELEEQLAHLLGPVRPGDAAALAFLSGFAEELFFRGAVQGAWGWLPAAVLFALLHTGPGRALRLWSLFAAAAGLLFGALMLWRGNLLAPVAAHFLVNCINLQALSRRFRGSGRLAGPGAVEGAEEER
jgi:membrane protease YdiL (CAAX protease family)